MMPYGTSFPAFAPLLMPGFAPPDEEQDFGLPDEASFLAEQQDQSRPVADMPPFRPRSQPLQPYVSELPSEEDFLAEQMQVRQQAPKPSLYLKPGETQPFANFADDNMEMVQQSQELLRELDKESPARAWDRYLADRAVPGYSTGKQLGSALRAKLALDKVDTMPLSQDEATLLARYLNDHEDEEKRTGWREAGDIAVQAPAFMGELLATGGAGTLAKQSVKKLAARMLARQLEKSAAARVTAKAAATAAEIAVRTNLNPQRIAKTAVERKINHPEESWLEAIAHSELQNLVEVGTEVIGGKVINTYIIKPISGVTAQLAKKTGLYDKLRLALIQEWLKKYPNRTLADGFGKVGKAGGWDGLLGEIGEERMNEIILGTAGAFGAKGNEYDFGTTGKLASGNISKAWEKFWPELVAFGAIAGVGKGLQMSANLLQPRTDSERIAAFLDSPTRRKWEKLPAEIREARDENGKLLYDLPKDSSEEQRRAVAEKMRSDAESAARQAAGAPDVQAATPADIAEQVAPQPTSDTSDTSDIPSEEDPADSAPAVLSEQDAQEVRDWVESLGVDEIIGDGTKNKPGFLADLEARKNPDEATLLTIQLMREAIAADSEPGVTSEVPGTPTTPKGGDPNGQVQEVRQGELQVREVPQVADPTPTDTGAGIGPAPVVPPTTAQPAVANGGTVAEGGGDSAPLGSEAATPPAKEDNFRFQVVVRSDSPDSKFTVLDTKNGVTKGDFNTREEANTYRDELMRKAGFPVPKAVSPATPVRPPGDGGTTPPPLSGNPPAQSSNPPAQSGKPAKKKSLDDIDSISDDELDAAIAGKKPAAPSQPSVAANPPIAEVGKPASSAPAEATLTNEPRSGVSARNQREQWIRRQPNQLLNQPDQLGAQPDQLPVHRKLSDHFADQLSAGKSYPTILEARKEAGEILGKKILAGTPETKVIDEAVEVGVVKAARRIIEQAGDQPARKTFTELGGLYQRQPRLGTRTSTSMVEQAYSTPAPLAFLASHLAGIDQSSTVYEPTAGNGMLVIGAKPSNVQANEINPGRAEALTEQGFHVTQQDATALTPEGKFDTVIANPPFGKVESKTGANKVFQIGNLTTNEVDQAIAARALESLKDGGRAVLILGAKGHKAKTPNDRKQAYLGKNKAFFEHLYDGYHVTDHFTVDGGLYGRQGASFPVDVIVIDGRKDAAPARAKPWQQEPQWFKTWDELGDAKLGTPVRDNLPPPKPPKNPPPPKPPKDDTPAPPPTAPPKKDDILSDKTKQAQKDFADKAREMAKKYGNKTFSPTSLDPEMLKDFYDLTKLGLRAGVRTFADYVRFIGKTINMGIAREWSGAMGEAWTNLGETYENLDSVGNVNEVLDAVEAEIEAENKPEDSIDELAETEHQVKYESESKNPFSAGTLIPTNQRDAVMESLAKVREAHGDIDTYVAKELKMSAEVFQSYFSSEQADALALAIHNYDRNGSALVLADQTGVGKGRVVAGMMRFANLRGLVPVFATEKSALFSDIVRDLTNIGENTKENPFQFIATNDTTGDKAVLLENDPLGRTLKQGPEVNQRLLEEAIDSKIKGGKFIAKSGRGKNGAKTEYKAVFTTYSQMQTVKGEETWKRPAFRRLMPHAFLILDEAHNAGGTEDSGNSRQSQKAAAAAAADRAEFIREITMTAKGVMYSTATWAKRPSTTTLYNRTDMPQAMNGDVDHLPEAIEKGGVPLMQVVSQMLAEAGQLIRREKSFKGVKFEPKTVPVSIEDADKMTSVFREIADRFDPAIEDIMDGVRTDVLGEGGTIAANNATGPQAVTATNFSSMMWNAVDQMLFALKADKAADEAIAAYNRVDEKGNPAGETPVIAVDATMEAILDDYVKENQINHGDAINLNFGDILHRYLERSRWYTVRLGTKGPDGKWLKEQVRLTDEELNQDTQTGNGLEIFKDIAAKIKALAIDAPASPIDWIRFRLEQAGIKVAEVTGRSNVIDYTGKGQMTLGVRDKEEVGNTGKLKTIRDLNSGELGALILNRSGSTGLSIHASKDFKNKKPRHMIIAQAAKNIDEFMQMLGRIHRTGQVVLPRYTLLMSNMPSENRPAAVLSKKLAKLNAAVTAKSKGAVGFDVPDVMNEVGGFVVQQFLQDNPEINDMLGALPLTFGTGIPPVEWYEELARKATGKVSILPYANQVEFWDAISQGFKDRIAQLDALGENPLIAKTLPLDAKTIEKFTLFEGDKDGGPFAQPAELEKVKAKIIGRPLTTQQVHDKLTKFYGMDSMLDFHREQSKWEGKSVYEITNEADAYREEAVRPLVNQAAVTRRLNMIDRQEQAIADAMRQYSPGNTVTVNIPGGELVGVVTDFKRVGKPKNPVQPSSWVVKVAVNDAVKEIDVPVSQVSARLVPQSSSMSGILETFDRAQSVSTENRWIATGNLLAAYDRLSDQHVKVTFFTDDQGKTRSGLLLPRSFNAAQYLEKRPVVMDTAANALTFLQRGGAALYTPDGVLGITLAGNQLIFSAPSARSRSGKYTTNPKIRSAALPKEFITPSGSQRTTMIVEGEPAMKKVLAAVLGETSLQANVDRELARAILGITASGEKIDSDTLEKLDDAEASRSGKMAIMGSPPVTVDAQSTTEADFPVSPGQIIRRLEKLFDVPIRSGGMESRSTSVGPVLAQYNPNEEVIRRLKQLYGELGPVVHEVAHHFNNDYPEVRKKMTPLARLDLKKLDYDKKQRRAYEGFAEFIRRWMTDDVAQLRKDAPDYFQHFEDFLKYNLEAADALNYGRELVNRWRTGMTASQRNQAVIRDTREPDRPADETPIERVKDWLYRAQVKTWTNWFDPVHFFKEIDEKTDASGYIRGPEESSLYDVADRLGSTAANHAYRAILKGVHSIGEGASHVYSPGLLDAFQQAELSEEELAEWTEWGISKRLLALREKHGDDYAMPFQLDDINKVMEDFDGYDSVKQKRFEKLGRAVHQFNDDLITMLRDSGLIGDKEHDRIIHDLDFYLPLERIQARNIIGSIADSMNMGQLINTKSPLKRLSPKGSQLPVLHPILSTIYRTMRFYDAAVRQQIMLQLAKQMDPQLGGAKGMGHLLSRIPPERAAVKLAAAQVWETIKPDLEKQGLDTSMVDPTALPESITLWRALYRPDPKNAEILVMVPTETVDPDTGETITEMKPVLYETHDLLYYVMSRLGPLELGWFLKGTKYLGDMTKEGAIVLSTGFAGSNVINDWFGYQFTGEAAGLKDRMVGPVKNLYGHSKATLGNWWNNTTNAGTEFDDLYEEDTGVVGSRFETGVKTPRDIFRKVTRAGFKTSTIQEAIQHPLQMLKTMKDNLGTIIGMSEVGPRLTEYVATLESHGFVLKADSTGKMRSFNTKTNAFELPPRRVRILASKAAADIMPFHRAGKWLRKWDAALPIFKAFNVAVTKYIDTHVKAAKGQPGMRHRLAILYLAQIAAELALWSMFGDDDRDEQRPGWQLSRFNVLGNKIPLPLLSLFNWAVPRGREWGIPGIMTRGAINQHIGNPHGLRDATIESAKQFVPPHTAPWTTPIELMDDRDWFRGQRIEGEQLQKLDKELRLSPNTRESARWLGENVGILSPLQWDFAINRVYGNLPGRTEDEIKAAREGHWEKTIPFMGGLTEKREYTRAPGELYDARAAAETKKLSEKARTGKVAQETYNEYHKLDKGADLVGDIRKLSIGKDSETKERYNKYATGAAIFFLGEDTNKRYPNPLTATDAPAEIKELAEKLKFSVATSAGEQLSSEDHKRDKFGKFKSDDRDDSILASRKLLKEIAPTYDDAWKLVNESMRAKRESLTSDAANARRARIKRLY